MESEKLAVLASTTVIVGITRVDIRRLDSRYEARNLHVFAYSLRSIFKSFEGLDGIYKRFTQAASKVECDIYSYVILHPKSQQRIALLPS